MGSGVRGLGHDWRLSLPDGLTCHDILLLLQLALNAFDFGSLRDS